MFGATNKITALYWCKMHLALKSELQSASLIEILAVTLMRQLTAAEVIAGTPYTATGSYEGTESFLRKLERITAKNFAEKLEDSQNCKVQV